MYHEPTHFVLGVGPRLAAGPGSQLVLGVLTRSIVGGTWFTGSAWLAGSVWRAVPGGQALLVVPLFVQVLNFWSRLRHGCWCCRHDSESGWTPPSLFQCHRCLQANRTMETPAALIDTNYKYRRLTKIVVCITHAHKNVEISQNKSHCTRTPMSHFVGTKREKRFIVIIYGVLVWVGLL